MAVDGGGVQAATMRSVYLGAQRAGAGLLFSSPDGGLEVRLHADYPVKMSGGALCAGNLVLATRAEDGWYLGERKFERVTFLRPVRIEVPGARFRAFGPFEGLTVSHDALSTARGVLARYHPLEECWYFDRHGSRCDILVVEPAGT